MAEISRLGRRVKMLRERAGMSQQQLADLSGVSRATIAGLESGTRANLLLDSAAKLARVLNVTLDRLVEDSLDDEPSPHLAATSN